MNILNEIEGDKYYCQYCHDDDINQHYLFIYEKETDKVIKTHEGGDAANLCDLLLSHGTTESKVDEIIEDGKNSIVDSYIRTQKEISQKWLKETVEEIEEMGRFLDDIDNYNR